MLGFGSATRIYVAIGATDMRKGFEGLFGIVRDRLMIEPLVDTFLYFVTHERFGSRFFTGMGADSGFAASVGKRAF
jgi:transposase